MDDLMLMEYLRSKGKHNMSDHDFEDKFKEMMMKFKRERDHDDYPYGKLYRDMYMRRHHDYPEDVYKEMYMRREHNPYFEEFYRTPESMHDRSSYKHSMDSYDHFNKPYAKFIVADMHHMENGRKYSGEKYDYNKAQEVLEKYKHVIPQDVTPCDIYVAINAQYHDYAELFKTWFGSNIDHKIIESAIVFWFKDADYNKGSKIWNYFKED